MGSQNEQWLDELFRKRPSEIKLGLQRMENSYRHMGSPLDQTPVVLVGGTNGKGTTSGIIACQLVNLGLKVGHYTSPHISCFSERIRISGNPLSIDQLKIYYEQLVEKLEQERFQSLTFFEVTSLLGFWLFKKFQVDVAVVEVGLGGRLDATNVLNPDVSLITSIALDHQEWLGCDIESICYEKAGIRREGKPLLIGKGAMNDNKCRDYFRSLNHDKKLFYGEAFNSNSTHIDCGASRSYLSYPRWLPNLSSYMRENFALATASVHALIKTSDNLAGCEIESFSDGNQSILNELPCDFFPSSFFGRGEWTKFYGTHVYLDLAHNPAGIIVSSNHYFDSCDQNLKKENHVGILSLLADKDVSGILEIIMKRFASVILFKSESVRAANLQNYEMAVNKLVDVKSNVFMFENFDKMIDELYVNPNSKLKHLKSVYFGGSFSAISEIRQKIASQTAI